MIYTRSIIAVTFFLLSLFIPITAQAGDASVTITAPPNDATLSANKPVMLEYEISPGPKGDHAHLMVDGAMAKLLRNMKGTFDMGKLTPGKHTIMLMIMNSGHSPIGVNASVTIMVK